MQRRLWVLWTSFLLGMVTTSVIVLGVFPRIMKNPIRPPEDLFLRWIRWGFVGLVLGAWLLGIWAVQKARRIGSAAGPSEAPAASESPTVVWALAGWSALEGGVIVALIYWLLTQDWGNTLPALLIHGLTFLWSNPLYIVGQSSGVPPS
ncbi:hypothetical protein HRbin11_01177 [bacterium HR11]|nr:hypothetical protein HRbin11_01177 [bacterium HR11]